LRFVSARRSPRAASRSRRSDSPDRTAAPRGVRAAGDTGESSRLVREDRHSGQAKLRTLLAANSSNRAPHCSHSNS
jgi:hypothetical protein